MFKVIYLTFFILILIFIGSSLLKGMSSKPGLQSHSSAKSKGMILFKDFVYS